jgi:hypothetical protein
MKTVKRFCTVTFPWGTYNYTRLPIGYSVASDFFNAATNEAIAHQHNMEKFFDDIAVFTEGTFIDHLKEVAKCLNTLQEKGFTMKPTKCSWCKKTVEYLCYTLSTDGVKPQPKKIAALLNMKCPKSWKQLRAFINYYKIKWPRHAHILKPLTDISGMNKIKWTNDQENLSSK